MLWNSNHTGRAPHRRAARDYLELAVDPLEERKMLAGDVTTTLAGGSLTISGDGQDNLLVAFQVNGDLALVGIDTAIADADESLSILGVDIDVKLISGITKDVTAILRGGDDAFLVGGNFSELDIEAMLSSSDVSFGPAVFSRDLNIYTNGGRDSVLVLGTEVGRDLKIDTGFGLNDNVIIGGGGTILAILDALENVDLGDLGNFQLGGFPLEDGGSEIIGQILSTLLGPVEIGRDLRIAGESSDDAIYVGGADVGRDAVITSNIGEDKLFFGTGAVLTIDLFDFPLLGFDGLLGDLGELEFSAAVSVGRNALLRAGDGDDISWVGGQRLFELYLGDFDPKDGGGGFGLTFEFAGGVVVDSNLTVDLGAHDDTVYIGVKPAATFDFPDFLPPGEGDPDPGFDVIVGRNMTLLTQADDDYVQIGGVMGEFSDGWWLAEVGGVLSVERNLLIDTGAGTDELVIGDIRSIDTLGGSSQNGEGFTSVDYQIEIGQNLTIRTGWHDDDIYIAGSPIDSGQPEGGSNGFYSFGNLRVGRDVSIDTDGGNDNLFVGFNEGFEETSTPSPLGLEDNLTAISIGRNLRVLTGDQDDLLTIDFTSVGNNVTISLGWGRDAAMLGSESKGDPVSIGGQLRMDGSLERDTISIENSYVEGRALISTGIRDDDVLIRASSFGNTLRVITGAGNDVVTMVDVSVNGQLRIDTQGENDNVELHEVFGNKLLVFAGADDDRVCVVDCSFANGATLNGGSGEADAYGTNLGSAVIIGFEEMADCGLEEE